MPIQYALLAFRGFPAGVIWDSVSSVSSRNPMAGMLRREDHRGVREAWYGARIAL
jgi:hypothetical protein